MREINNLFYALEINYANHSGVNTSISIKMYDHGLKIKCVKVGNISITEETINGRVLSGRFDNSNIYCGYKFHYQNGESLLNINPNISLNTAISLINSTKMEYDFLSAELVLSSISRNDYRVVSLDKGSLNIIKTISAENEKSESCSLQESIDLSKLDGEETFVVRHKKRVYKMNNKCVIEENQTLVDSDIKLQLNELSDIINQHPQNCKELIELKDRIKKISTSGRTNGEKIL